MNFSSLSLLRSLSFFIRRINKKITFILFFKRLFRPMKTLLLRHPQNNYRMWLYQLNLMCEELSYQITNTSTVNQSVFCYYWKFTKIIIMKKTLASVVAINAEMHFFWIHIRHTWLNVFGLTLSFPTFTFSVGIKFFIRHPVILFGMLILLK